MISFFIPAILLLVIVLVLLLKPLMFGNGGESTSRRQMNAAIYQEELEKLASERAAGRIDAQEYEMSHAEMRQRLFQDAEVEDESERDPDERPAERLLEPNLVRFSVKDAEVVFLCVPTPQGDDGSADLTYVQAAAAEIADALPFECIVVNKSTVPVGSRV